MLLDQKVDWGVDDVVDDWGHGEDASEDTYNIDEEGVPLVVGDDMEDSHRVGFISKWEDGYLK